jgi:hypothetical protein
MTGVTYLSNIIYLLEPVLPGVFVMFCRWVAMAHYALTGSHRAVYIFVLVYAGVAFGSDATGLLGKRGGECTGKQNHKK